MKHFRKLFTCLLCCCLCATLTAQTSLTDSLQNLLHRATTDTAKVMVYNRFSRGLQTGANRDLEQARHYAQEGLALAERVQFDKGMAEMLRTIGNACYYLNEFDKAIEHYEQALKICEKIHDTNGMALNYYNISLIYNEQSRNYDSLELLLKALANWKKAGNTNYLLIAYNAIIGLYSDVAEWRLAEVYAKEALYLAIETGNRQQEAALYDMLANIHFSVDNVEAADEYYQKSIQVYRELNDQSGIARIIHNIADNLHSDNPEMQMDLYRKSAAIFEKISPAYRNLFTIYYNISRILHDENHLDSARYYMEKALSKAILSGSAPTIAMAYNYTGSYYMEMGDIVRAEKDFSNAYDVALKYELYKELSDALSGLSEISNRKGEYQTAFDYLRRYQSIKDSLMREESKNTVQQLTIHYEFEKEMTEKNETIRAQEQSIRYQRSMVAVISVALAGAAILLLFIRRAKLKVEQQHREITSINGELKELHTVKDKLFSVVAHDLRSPISSLVTLLRLVDCQKMDAEKQHQLFKDITCRVDNTYNLLDNLLRWSKSQMQGIVPAPVFFDAHEESCSVTESLQAIAANKQIVLENRIALQQVYADRDMFTVVVRNLTTNAIKYTSAGGSIILASQLSGDMLLISVKDTGTGMPQEVQETLFKLSETRSQQGTGNESGTGLGLAMCADFVKANGGNIWFTSVLGEGSTFSFSVPVGN